MTKFRTTILILAMIAGLAATASAAQDRDHDGDRNWQPVQYKGNNDAAYQQGMRDGRADARAGRASRQHNSRWHGDEQRAYDDGYSAGYRAAADRNHGAENDRVYGPGGGVYGGPNGGPYGNSGTYGTYGRGAGNWTQQARNMGYQDGLSDGSNDLRTGHSFRPTHDDNYKNADRGYSSSFGGKDQYKQVYRQGYEQGYQAGYRR